MATTLSRIMDPELLRRGLDAASAGCTQGRDRLRDLPLPPVPRYAVQSAKLRPVEAGQDPSLVTLTLRKNGDLRVVHGNRDVHEAVSAAVKEANEGKEGEEEAKPKEEKPDREEGEGQTKEEGEKAEEKKEEGTKEEEEKGESEAKKKTEEEDRDKKEEAEEAKEEEKKEPAAGIAEPEEKDGLWKINMQPVGGEGIKTLTEKERIQVRKVLPGELCFNIKNLF